MKHSKIIGIALAVVNAILIIVCAAMYLKSDRTEPKMEFQAVDTVYREGMNPAELFEGITAFDRVDGVITDRIVIEKITENPKDSCVVVFYAVSDKAGNVAKSSRMFPAMFIEEAEGLMEAGISAEMNQKCMPENLEGAEEPPLEPVQTPAPEPEKLSDPVPTPSPEPAKLPAPTSEPAATPKPASTQNPAVPVLALKVSEVRVNTGQGPAWVDIIETLSDDEDGYETLFANLSVSKYEKNKAGTYQVTVYTEDSDGNKSSPVPLSIIVQ